MVWGAISGQGAGPLYFVEGTMNSKQYLMTLKKIFVPYYNVIEEVASGHIFMQDGVPCHTAKTVKTYLHQKEIPILEWPPNSPDLNPIENVWSTLKRLVYSKKNTNIEIEKKKH